MTERKIRVYFSRYENSQEQSIAGKKLLRYALLRDFNTDIDTLKTEKGENGKPYFMNSPICYSVSHSQGAVAVAVAGCDVGIDIEPLRKIEKKIGVRYLGVESDDMLLLTHEWIRRESYGKMTGEGFFHSGEKPPLFRREYTVHCEKDFYICVTARSDCFEDDITEVDKSKL